MNLRERLRQMDEDQSIVIWYIFKPETPIFQGNVRDARKWANRTWAYRIESVARDTIEGTAAIIFYVKKLDE